jgi:Domain of unknown function (DUF3427)/HNH endonuclease
MDNLIVGDLYTRKDLSVIFDEPSLNTSREGIYSSNTLNSYLFFVDLVKEGKDERFHFNDYFDGDIFHWDSQTTQHINSPRIQRIVNKEIQIFLFTRIFTKIKSKTQPFVYCGRLEYIEHDENTSKPVHIVYQSLDFDETTINQSLIEIYNWKPEMIGKSSTNNVYLVKRHVPRPRGEQKKPNYTERRGLVTSRVGQGWYRQEILKKWGNKCSITGCSHTEILISSHIKGWSECNEDERLDPDNGILLSPNIDSLFDKHLISFEDDGSILISDKLSKENLGILGISNSIKLKVDDGMKKYLQHHRRRLDGKV